MKIVVAETVFLGKEAFETLGETSVIPDRQIGPDHLNDADALIIRSKTAVTPNLLARSPVRFIGTATAGFEHLDTAFLDEQEIAWCAAPGCNADSVADYLVSALLCLHADHGVDLEARTLGVIGVGQVGSRVARRAEALGMTILLNDPPRAEREGEDAFTPLDDLLSQSDAVTLHVPLTKAGPFPTRHMADASFFQRMKPGALFINASRGAVVDSDALLRAMENNPIKQCVLDVWDPEPHLREDLLRSVTLGTPHIAGHSLEGKLNGTVQVYREACRFFGQQACWDPQPFLPPCSTPTLHLDVSGKSDLDLLWQAVSAVYDIRQDALTPEQIPLFDRLRATYRVRREFFNTRISLSAPRPDLSRKFKQIGFSI